VSYFFDGLADPSTDEGGATRPSDEQTVHAFLMTAEGLELAKLFPGLPRGRIRRRFLDLMRALAGVDDVEEDREG
jgi:hypothetical protein